MRKLLRYLLPPLTNREKIPLAPRVYKARHSIYGEPNPAQEHDIAMLIGHSTARDRLHAARLLRENPNLTTQQIIRQYKRQRRRESRLSKAWRRLKALWIILLIPLIIPQQAQAQAAITATIRAIELNVRSGPDLESEILGTVKRGSVIEVSGVDRAKNWLFFRYWGKEAWIRNNPAFLTLSGPISALPIVTVREELYTGPAVSLARYSVAPAVPQPGEAFSLALDLTNSGAAAGPFSIAGYAPGGFFYTQVRNLDARETREIVLSAQAGPNTGRFEIPVILDVDNQLSPEVRKDQRATVTIHVDRAFTAQARISIARFSAVDLHGGRVDLEFSDGLKALNGARLGLLATDRAGVHYDLLGGIAGETISASDLRPGALIGFVLSEGRRGFLEIISLGGTLDIEYFVYVL